ncbi:hypothetical protein SAY87_011053 [Trapa incisa]|uniref:Uncharacterized protein n=1 Tax=Trapa incisa TaxID=236973 RepID=A0AAN7JB87_9MYRT|nr:hypothetical protein SAY87_011053 [Trapa incisa]
MPSHHHLDAPLRGILPHPTPCPRLSPSHPRSSDSSSSSSPSFRSPLPPWLLFSSGAAVSKIHPDLTASSPGWKVPPPSPPNLIVRLPIALVSVAVHPLLSLSSATRRKAATPDVSRVLQFIPELACTGSEGRSRRSNELEGVDGIIHLDTDELRQLLLDVPEKVVIVIFPNYESSIERDDIKDHFSVAIIQGLRESGIYSSIITSDPSTFIKGQVPGIHL